MRMAVGIPPRMAPRMARLSNSGVNEKHPVLCGDCLLGTVPWCKTPMAGPGGRMIGWEAHVPPGSTTERTSGGTGPERLVGERRTFPWRQPDLKGVEGHADHGVIPDGAHQSPHPSKNSSVQSKAFPPANCAEKPPRRTPRTEPGTHPAITAKPVKFTAVDFTAVDFTAANVSSAPSSPPAIGKPAPPFVRRAFRVGEKTGQGPGGKDNLVIPEPWMAIGGVADEHHAEHEINRHRQRPQADHVQRQPQHHAQTVFHHTHQESRGSGRPRGNRGGRPANDSIPPFSGRGRDETNHYGTDHHDTGNHRSIPDGCLGISRRCGDHRQGVVNSGTAGLSPIRPLQSPRLFQSTTAQKTHEQTAAPATRIDDGRTAGRL